MQHEHFFDQAGQNRTHDDVSRTVPDFRNTGCYGSSHDTPKHGYRAMGGCSVHGARMVDEMTSLLTRPQEPDRKLTRDILQNWAWSAKDLPRDSAEIDYYTISPIFRGTKWAKPTPRTQTYDEESAEMVEDVMRELYKWRPKARDWLIAYWLHAPSVRVLATVLGISKSTVQNRVGAAHDAFAKHWGLLFMDIDR